MAENRELINGVDGTTGEYLGASEHQQATPPLTPKQLREYRWWIEQHGLDDPNRAPVHPPPKPSPEPLPVSRFRSGSDQVETRLPGFSQSRAWSRRPEEDSLLA